MDFDLENRKVLYLERLYERDRRYDKNHPLHDTYTGLLVDRQRELIDWERDSLYPPKVLPATTKPA